MREHHGKQGRLLSAHLFKSSVCCLSEERVRDFAVRTGDHLFLATKQRVRTHLRPGLPGRMQQDFNIPAQIWLRTSAAPPYWLPFFYMSDSTLHTKHESKKKSPNNPKRKKKTD